MPLHTDRQYEEELQELRAKVLEMGGLVEKTDRRRDHLTHPA